MGAIAHVVALGEISNRTSQTHPKPKVADYATADEGPIPGLGLVRVVHLISEEEIEEHLPACNKHASPTGGESGVAIRAGKVPREEAS